MGVLNGSTYQKFNRRLKKVGYRDDYGHPQAPRSNVLGGILDLVLPAGSRRKRHVDRMVSTFRRPPVTKRRDSNAQQNRAHQSAPPIYRSGKGV